MAATICKHCEEPITQDKHGFWLASGDDVDCESNAVDCGSCGGDGDIECDACGGTGELDDGSDCETCDGHCNEECADCGGDGSWPGEHEPKEEPT